jgi:hypothetical protein
MMNAMPMPMMNHQMPMSSMMPMPMMGMNPMGMNPMGMSPMMGMNPMMGMGMPMNMGMPMMMPMMGMGMMPMMCKVTMEMGKDGMICKMMPMDPSHMEQMKERMQTMMSCMHNGMPCMMTCGGMPMMMMCC